MELVQEEFEHIQEQIGDAEQVQHGSGRPTSQPIPSQ